MNIVFLSSESTHHYFLMNEIHKVYPVKKVFFETYAVVRKPLPQRIKSWLFERNLLWLARAAVRKLLLGRDSKKEIEFENRRFFPGATPALNREIPFERVTNFNRPEVVELVGKEQPDLVVVFGTRILKGEILNVAKVAMLNIHRGILPLYRGGSVDTWAFLNQDFKNVGTTVHLCTAELDSGDIVGQKFYQLQKDDAAYTIRYRTTLLAVDILKETIDQYQKGTVRYRKQGPSRILTSKDLTLAKELTAKKNLKQYLQTLKNREEA